MKPTIGRIVTYKVREQQKLACGYNPITGQTNNPQYELPAIIVAVWSDTCINLQVFIDGQQGCMWITSALQGDNEGEWNWPVISN